MISIAMNNIKKSFGIDVILQDISFTINEAERVALVGSNGTGKTTWLNNQKVNKSKKCLIITPDSSEWKTVPIITPGEVRTFTGIGKLIYNDDTLEVIKNNFSKLN